MLRTALHTITLAFPGEEPTLAAPGHVFEDAGLSDKEVSRLVSLGAISGDLPYVPPLDSSIGTFVPPVGDVPTHPSLDAVAKVMDERDEARRLNAEGAEYAKALEAEIEKKDAEIKALKARAKASGKSEPEEDRRGQGH